MVNAPSPEVILWTPDDGTGPWEVTIHWRAQHGVPTPVGFDLHAWRGSWAGNTNSLPRGDDEVALPAVTAKLLREMPIGRLINETLAMWSQHLHPEWDPTINPMEADLEQFVTLHPAFGDLIARSTREREAVGLGMKHGRDLGDDHYRRVAAIYAAAVQAGEPPTRAVSEALTLTTSGASKQVARARMRGFLPRTTRGRVGPITEEL